MLDLPQERVRLGRRDLSELRRLAEQRQPHPDPAVQRRAVAWARRPTRSAGRVTAVVVAGTLGAAALAAGVRYHAALLIVLLGLPLTLVAVALATQPVRASLIHRVNLAALLDNLSMPAEPVVVEPIATRWRWRRELPVAVVLAVNAAAGVAARAYVVPLFCVFVLVVALVASRGFWYTQMLPLRLDEAGVGLTTLDLRVPWTAIDTVDLATSADQQSFGVAWKLSDPAAIAGHVPAGLQRHIRSSQGRLVIWLDPRDHPPEKIVLASRAYLAGT